MNEKENPWEAGSCQKCGITIEQEDFFVKYKDDDAFYGVNICLECYEEKKIASIFSELEKCISQHTKYDKSGVRIGTFDYMDWWEYKEVKKKYIGVPIGDEK